MNDDAYVAWLMDQEFPDATRGQREVLGMVYKEFRAQGAAERWELESTADAVEQEGRPPRRKTRPLPAPLSQRREPEELSQREKLCRLLEAHLGRWVPLPEILRLGIAQYGPRILELRRELEPKGWRIENRTQHRDGHVLSWYRLLPPQAAQRELFSAPTPEANRWTHSTSL